MNNNLSSDSPKMNDIAKFDIPSEEEYKKAKAEYDMCCKQIKEAKDKMNALIDLLSSERQRDLHFSELADKQRDVVRMYEISEDLKKKSKSQEIRAINFGLIDIKDGKVCGVFGGWNEKYSDVYNYIASKDVKSCYKFDNIEDAIKAKDAYNGKSLLEPNFEIIVIKE